MHSDEQARRHSNDAADDELLLVDDADAQGGDDVDALARLDGVDPALNITEVDALLSAEDDEEG